MPSDYAYLNDPETGANLSTILGGHTLDLAISVLGKITHVDALSTVNFASVELIETNVSNAGHLTNFWFSLDMKTAALSRRT
jgi:hypothetical protein